MINCKKKPNDFLSEKENDKKVMEETYIFANRFRNIMKKK